VNVVDLNTPTSKLAVLIEQMRRDLPFLLESQVLSAQVTRAKYEALVAAGFTEQQALQLCKDAV
jgi:hypothetical protein